MTDRYAQEPAEEYGDQLQVANRLKFPFVRLASKAIESMQIITVDAFVVYCILLKFADNADWTCYPTYKLIQQISGYGRKRVMKALRILQQVNMIERKQMRKGREYGANLYTLVPVEEWTIENPDYGGAKMRPLNSEPPYRHHKLDPVLSRSNSYLDPEKSTQKRAREEEQKILSQLQQDYEGGNDILQCPSCQEEWIAGSHPRHMPGCDRAADADSAVDILSYTQGPDGEPRLLRPEDEDGLATGEDTDTPEACRYYHPGFECEHMQAALARTAELWWGRTITPAMVRSYLNEFRAKEGLHEIVHAYTPHEIEHAATHWKTSGEKLRLPLFFNQFASTLATAQSVQAPGDEPAWARYARKLEELGE